jgi:hypothetical protein
LEVDLHRTFAIGPVGFTVPLDELFREQATFELGGRALPTLTPVSTFLQVCINAAVGDLPPRACSLRDVVQVGALVEDRFDVVVDTAHRWGIGMLVQRAIDLAWRAFRLSGGPFSEWAANYRPSARERWMLRAYLTPARSYTRPAASLLVIRGVRARARYARALLVPQHDYLTSRGWRLDSHARRALHSLRALATRHE